MYMYTVNYRLEWTDNMNFRHRVAEISNHSYMYLHRWYNQTSICKQSESSDFLSFAGVNYTYIMMMFMMI